MGEDEIQSQKLRLDMVEFVLAAMAQIVLADGGEESTRVNVIDKAFPRVSLRRGVVQRGSTFSTKHALRFPLLAFANARNCRTVK